MDRTVYNQMVQEWMFQVECCRGTEAEKSLEYAGKLKDYGTSAGDEALLGFAYYHMAETYYMLNDVESFFAYILQGLECLQNTEQWELTANACNLLGIASNNQGNAPFALDYYLSGVTVCQKHNLPLIAAIIQYNIGTIYITYEEFNRAIHYFEDSWKGFSTISPEEDYYEYKGVVYISLASCYLELDNLERAWEYLDQVHQECEVHLSDLNQLYFLCVQARYYNELPDLSKRDACIEDIAGKMNPNVPVMEIFDDFYSYCRMLLGIHKYKELWDVLDILDKVVKTSKLVHLQRKLLNIKLSYYKEVGDSSGYLQAAGLYYELSQMKEQEERFVMGTMLNVRFSLEEARLRQQQVEQEKKLLKQRSETDSLTGIANRMCLNQRAEEMFLQALSESYYLAVEILDMDYFKEYNDNYGHQKGDECLKAIANELRIMQEKDPRIFCARYGGDEFVIVYQNQSPEEVMALAEDLKARIHGLQVEHKFSKAIPFVSISQGICCDVPRADIRVWDFLYNADLKLYQVKEKCRNGIAMGSCSVMPAEKSKDSGKETEKTGTT